MTAATALAALLPVTSLATRLGLPPWRGGDLGMAWSTLAWSPTATHHTALVLLFQLLLGIAIGVLAVAGMTLISLSVARASARTPELSLRRAVGASRRHCSHRPCSKPELPRPSPSSWAASQEASPLGARSSPGPVT